MTIDNTGQTRNDSGDFYSTKEAAKLLGVAHRTVQLWVESGVLQAWKTAGGHRRIIKDSVERLVQERELAMAAKSGTPAPAAPSRVLVVDDEPAMLRLYELELAGWDLPMDIVKAHDGFEALLEIGRVRPAVLITDLHMPGMDGFRMIETLRANAEFANIRVIVVSGIESSTITSMSLPSDILVLPKPVPFERLRAAVEEALQEN
ncbi:excisionase family DNA binding protein [Pseudoduganella lurida]|uniref:Excisionase family DNA binding protein n=1 Tax=Pseudoduganella lurida TaxID=1036180 RepID=A0A562RL01_9BURK|nr:response regulator [Pseudoduganella lurida]TWI69719.1 excisionase family DNA binding protein [Pseudoduganella lurida]